MDAMNRIRRLLCSHSFRLFNTAMHTCTRNEYISPCKMLAQNACAKCLRMKMKQIPEGGTSERHFPGRCTKPRLRPSQTCLVLENLPVSRTIGSRIPHAKHIQEREFPNSENSRGMVSHVDSCIILYLPTTNCLISRWLT